MRKILFIIVGVVTFVAVPVYAATISFAPTTISVTKGETFSLTLNADGAGTKIYTVKASVSYPASTLEAIGFKLDPSWPLLSPGNSIDNTSGKLVETGGFIGGFSGKETFGIITFRAKESGSATISVTSDSVAYDAQSKDTLSGPQGESVVTIALPVVPIATPTPTISSQPITVEVVTEPETAIEGEVLSEGELEGSQQPLLAANIASSITLGTGSAFVGLLSILILILVGYGVYRAVRKTRSK